MEKCQRKIRPASLLLFVGLLSLFNCQLGPAWLREGAGMGPGVPSCPIVEVPGSCPCSSAGPGGLWEEEPRLPRLVCGTSMKRGLPRGGNFSLAAPTVGGRWALVLPPAGSTDSGGSTQGLKSGGKKGKH